MENRGKLLVSTQCNLTKKLVFEILTVAAAIFIFYQTVSKNGVIREMTKELDSKAGEFIICILIGVWIGGALASVFKGFKSYCMVYENAVVGTTQFSFFNGAEALKTFTLNYDEVTNISENKATLHIYTSYATFKVNAWDNCAAAAQEIRKRMGNSAVTTPTPTPVAMKPVQPTQAPTTKVQPAKEQTSNANSTQTSYIGLNTQNNRIKKQ